MPFLEPGQELVYLQCVDPECPAQRVGYDHAHAHTSASAEGGNDVGKTIAEMTDEVREVNTEKGWRTGGNTFGDYIALMHSELSEALEAYRDRRLADATRALCEPTRRHNPDEDHAHQCKPQGVGSEFADILIRLLDVADIYGIDLDAEFERKIAYNRTRPYQHGGRTLSEVGRAVRRAGEESHA